MPQQYSSQLNLKHFPYVQSDQAEQTILNRNTLNIGNVLVRMYLFMDQNCSVLPPQSAKVWEFYNELLEKEI